MPLSQQLCLLCLCLYGTIANGFSSFETSVTSPSTTAFLDEFMIDLGPNISIPYGDTLRLDVLTNRALDGDETWLWSDPQNLSCLRCTDPNYITLESTLLTLTITDGDGCVASTNIFIEVVLPDEALFIPNAFSPNWDGINDHFTVFTGDNVHRINSLQIFSRKGDQVFYKLDFVGNDKSASWDGTFNGKDMNPGVYVYLMEIVMFEGSTKQIRGTVNLVR